MNIDINKLKQALIDGQAVIAPTDTVYGIICDATNKQAIENIYNIKNREHSKPLILFVDNIDKMQKYANISSLALKIAQKFMPGPITLIVNRKKDCKLPANINMLNDSISFRIPNNKLILNLLKNINFPLASTSANISGQPACHKFSDLDADVIKKSAFAIKDDPKEIIQPSSVIDIRDENNIKILRQGLITLDDIKCITHDLI